MLTTMDWVQWYNEDRIHLYSGDMSPKKYEEIHYEALESGNLTGSSQICWPPDSQGRTKGTQRLKCRLVIRHAYRMSLATGSHVVEVWQLRA
jgi:hypothetical protein